MNYKMRLLLTVCIFSILLIITSVVALASGEKVLKYAHTNPISNIMHQQAVIFAKEIAKRTDDLRVEVYPSGQLGSMEEKLEGVRLGTIEIINSAWGEVFDYVPEFSIFDGAYIFNSLYDVISIVKSPIVKELNQKLIDKMGVRLLYWFYYGVRDLTCNRPIYTPKDLRGVKIRALTWPVHVANVEALGAVPTPIDFAELYSSLQLGVVDGQENPLCTILDSKFYETQKYLMLTGHLIHLVPILINEKVYQSLTDEQKQFLEEAGQIACLYSIVTVLQQEKEYLDKLRDFGMTIIGPEEGLDREAFKERALPILTEKFKEEWGDLPKRINEYLNK